MNLKVSEALGIILMVTGNYTLAAIIMPAQIDPTTIFVLFTHSIIIGVYAVMASRIFTLLAYKTLITTIDNEVKTNSIEKQHIELKALDNAKTLYIYILVCRLTRAVRAQRRNRSVTASM